MSKLLVALFLLAASPALAQGAADKARFSLGLSPYEMEIVEYAVTWKLPRDIDGVRDLRLKVLGRDQNFSLPEIIRVMIALSRLEDPEADELLAKIKAKFPGAR